MTEIKVEVDDLDGEKVETLNEELGEEQTRDLLSSELTQIIRTLYDRRESLQEELG
jgi:hypothetical protein